MIKLSGNRNICCGLKKVVAKSRARVYFEQQILALLLVFHQTHNLSRNKFAHVARQVEGFCISYFAAFMALVLYSEARRPRVQGLHPATSGICFSVHVVPSSNPRSRFVNSQLVCLLPVGILKLCLSEIFVPLFQWHACKLAKPGAKCMTTINEIFILTFFLHLSMC